MYSNELGLVQVSNALTKKLHYKIFQEYQQNNSTPVIVSNATNQLNNVFKKVTMDNQIEDQI